MDIQEKQRKEILLIIFIMGKRHRKGDRWEASHIIFTIIFMDFKPNRNKTFKPNY